MLSSRGAVLALLGLGATSSLILSGCNDPKYYQLQPFTEVVMTNGMVITVTNKNGPLSIAAKSGTWREYTWDGATRGVRLMVRFERWYGSLGLYGERRFASNLGISRAVVQEGQIHVANEEEALNWLRMPYQKETLDLVYTRDGLAVGWVKVPFRRQLNVDVWQIYINGKKPENLSGARDNQITVGGR